jgi:hypothetical protein
MDALLRFPYGVRDEKDYFDDIRDTKLGNLLSQARVTAAPTRPAGETKSPCGNWAQARSVFLRRGLRPRVRHKPRCCVRQVTAERNEPAGRSVAGRIGACCHSTAGLSHVRDDFDGPARSAAMIDATAAAEYPALSVPHMMATPDSAPDASKCSARMKSRRVSPRLLVAIAPADRGPGHSRLVDVNY